MLATTAGAMLHHNGVRLCVVAVCLLRIMGVLNVVVSMREETRILMATTSSTVQGEQPQHHASPLEVDVSSITFLPPRTLEEETSHAGAPEEKTPKVQPPESLVLASSTTPGGVIVSSEAKMLEYFSNSSCIPSAKAAGPAWLNQMVVNIGAMKGGTKALHTFLEEHPKFVSRCDKDRRTQELNYFNHNVSDPSAHLLNQTQLQLGYASRIEALCPRVMRRLRRNPRKRSLDDTPLYLQESATVPRLLNCAIPHSKLLCILRNPTDRAFSHYNFYKEKYNKCTEKTFEEWIDVNLDEMQQAGLVFGGTPSSTIMMDPYDELLAWKRYTERLNRDKKAQCRTFVSRGLYAISILHYKTALMHGGRQGDLLVLESDELRGRQRQTTYNRVLNFLDLEERVLSRTAKKNVHVTVYKETVKDATRERLDAFFKPYNERLFEMLQWDPNTWSSGGVASKE